MRRPIIGITTSACADGQLTVRDSYIQAITAHGGLPCPLCTDTDSIALTDLCDTLDGLLFGGGCDLNPNHYGETVIHPSVEISDARERFELALFSAFMQTKKPIFGICRGVQLMNVALGGSLIQHLDGHRQTPTAGNIPTHDVLLAEKSLLCRICGCDRISVNSFHHQAIKHIGKDASISAITPNGVVEGIELPQSVHPFFLGVQWHPELFWREHPSASLLFSAFVSACVQK